MTVARPEYSDERRRRLTHRAVPVLAAAVVAILAIVLLAGGGPSDEVTTARRFASAWARGDYAAMRELTTGDAQKRWSPAAFARVYRDSAATATATGIAAGRPRDVDGGSELPLTIRTRVFGPLRARLTLPMKDARVDWSPRLAFPGLRKGELLTRRSVPPPRASILARDRTTLVSGPIGARTATSAGSAIAGQVAVPKGAAAQEAVYARGFPHGWRVGTSGLEALLEPRVAGTPGGTLLEGTRTVARAAPRPAKPTVTTLDPRVQAAAQAALGSRLGGVVAIDPRTGEVRSIAGLGYSAPQPPGSTFKIVTLTAALTGKVAKPGTPFPVASYALIDGVKLQNANGESCGGSVAQGFVESCNSVYAPLGVRVGAGRLVAAAEAFGWNRRPPFPGARPSTIPAAPAIGSKLELGSSAIGQGKVLATPLQMATVAQTVAAGGVRHEPTLLPGATAPGTRVMPKRTARTITKLMVAVVARGTGTAAALGPGEVAGKTGTAELESTTGPAADQNQNQDVQSHTDAWFTSFAPARHARIAVAVMLVRAGAGGDTAAPVAREVLQAALAGR